jgi:hypothetical protein
MLKFGRNNVKINKEISSTDPMCVRGNFLGHYFKGQTKFFHY